MRLSDLVRGLPMLGMLPAADPAITGLTNDSRQAAPGSLFVAIRGEKADGHRYIAQAVERGAAAVVCEELPAPPPHCPVVQVADTHLALSALADRFYGSPSRRLCLTGITGTEGKTSTTAILRTITIPVAYFIRS
jgi:UDP-N-acetylmuramoyl-L-alanyl-D-glutamate--2,6-diaminopimelate ligase